MNTSWDGCGQGFPSAVFGRADVVAAAMRATTSTVAGTKANLRVSFATTEP
jgi:hypothetical protein